MAKQGAIKIIKHGHKKISMVAIVKNEEAVLERCINSVRSIVDEFIIVDTGSTDGTKEIIKKYGDLHEIPYTTEVETKQKALALATGDYVLLMDADEWIGQNAIKLRHYADADINGVSTLINDVSGEANTVTNKYGRKRMFKNDGSCTYCGPNAHGFLKSKHPFISDQSITVFHSHDHKAGVETNKIERTLGPLVQAIKDNPKDTRAHFYLARTLMDGSLKKYEEAITTFGHYLAMPNSNFAAERWWAQYNIAQCYEYLEDIGKSLVACDKTIAMDTSRAEAYVLKGRLLYDQKKWHDAASCFEVAIKLPEPKSLMFLDPRQYWEVPADYLSTCLFKMGNVRGAYNLTKELIGRRSWVDDRLITNLNHYEKQLSLKQ